MKNLKYISILVGFALLIFAVVYYKPKTEPTPSPKAPVNLPVGETVATASFTCDAGKTIDAIFTKDSVSLRFNGSSVASTYPQLAPLFLMEGDFVTHSSYQVFYASGERYGNDEETFVFWSNNDWAYVEENGFITYENCMNPESPANQAHLAYLANIADMLLKKTWVWQSAVYDDGTKIIPQNPEKFTLIFANNGTFSVTTDCNGGSGKYKVANNQIELTEIMRTLMFCAESQETEFYNILENTWSFSFSSDGELFLRFSRETGASATFR